MSPVPSAEAAATSWQDIQGLNNWEGLLEPLNLGLREAGIRYGEFVEAIYDAIDLEADPKYVNHSLFGKSNLFSCVGISSDYTITKYLYCTLVVDGWGKLFGIKEGSSTVWMGYIAVSNDGETKRLGRRDVAVVIRGTLNTTEWWKNFHFNLVDFKELGPAPYPTVLSGFLSMYTASDPSKMFGGLSLKDQIFKELKRLVQAQEYSKEDMSITFAGHSLGGGLAQLAAPDFGYNQLAAVSQGRTVMVTAFVFGAPKTGNAVFKERAEKVCKVIRIVDTGDPVPQTPLIGMYEHIGVEWKVNWADSPSVQDLGWLSSKCHNLELYLHCIAGQKTAAGIPAQAPAVQKALGTTDEEDESVEVPEELHPLKEAFKVDSSSSLEQVAKEQAAIVKASRQMLALSNSASGDGSAATNFEMVVQRDPALMNKTDDIVVAELGIPTSWWVHARKNMRNIGGQWFPRHRWPDSDIPSEENPEFN